MHRFPKDPETRQRWTKFVRKRRPNFAPTDTSFLCSMHFAPTCFTRRQDISVPGIEASVMLNRTLVSGAVPTEDGMETTTSVSTKRERRHVSS